MSNRGKKVREIITIHGTFDDGSLEDEGPFASIDEAVIRARKILEEYSRKKEDKKYYKNFDVSVCFNEFEYEDGNIWGEPTCFSIKDLKPRRR